MGIRSLPETLPLTSDPHRVGLIGGGAVGCLLALTYGYSMRHQKIRPVQWTLLDAHHWKVSPPDERAWALNSWTLRLLQTLVGSDALSHLQSEAIQTIFWNGTSLHAPDQGLEEWGRIIAARPLMQLLREAVKQLPFVEVLDQTTVQRWHRHHQKWQIETTETLPQPFDLLIGADGAHSVVADWLGGTCSLEAPVSDRTPWVAWLSTGVAAPHTERHAAYEWMGHLPQSPSGQGSLSFLAAVPLPPHPVNGPTPLKLIWILPQHALEWHLNHRRASWSKAFPGAETRIASAGEHASVLPLQATYVPMPIGLQTVVIGNAAQTVWPVGAQGLNLGARDAYALGRSLASAEASLQNRLIHYWAARMEDRATFLTGWQAFYKHLVTRGTVPPSWLLKIPFLSAWLGYAAGWREPLPFHDLGAVP